MTGAKSILGSLVCFALVYAVLIVPWPGVAEAYGGFFRGVGRLVFAREEGARELTFDSLPAPRLSYRITRIEIVNRQLMAGDGSGPVRNFDVDQQALGWVPSALFIALMTATPLPWRRRIAATLTGVFLLQGFVFLTVALGISLESAEVFLAEFTHPAWGLATGLQTAMAASACSFVTPIVVWILLIASGVFGWPARWGIARGLHGLFIPGGRSAAGEKTARPPA